MKKLYIVVFVFLLLSQSAFSKTYYVTPTGSSSGNGNSFASSIDIVTALAQVEAGDSIVLQGGTYLIPYTEGAKNTIYLTKSGQQGNPIYFVSYNDSRAILDFQFPEHKWVQNSYGFDITGSYWYFKGITITNAGYQGAYVKGAHNTFNNCVFSYCRFSGLEINKGGSYTTVINCDAYNNYNPKATSSPPGGAADGFAPKQLLGPGNVLIGCRAWGNSDDGYDTFGDPSNPNVFVIMENCWAFHNGSIRIGDITYSGNKVGFKLGGSNVPQQNQAYNCVAFGHAYRGFDENNNKGGVNIYNCLAYDNHVNYAFGGTLNSGQQHDFRNNISFEENSASNIKSSNKQLNNTWNSGFSVSAFDFKSLDLTLAAADRKPDGSLPDNDLFRLTSGSSLIDAGTSTGRPFLGAGPDIGPFEYEPAVTSTLSSTDMTNDIIVFPTIVSESINIRLLSILESANVYVYTLNGKMMYSGAMENSDLSVPCSSFPAGTYFVKVKNNGVQKIFKIIKF